MSQGSRLENLYPVSSSRSDFVHYTESSQTFSIPDFSHSTIDGDHHSTSMVQLLEWTTRMSLQRTVAPLYLFRPTDSRSSKIKTQPAEHTFVQITFDATSGKLPTSGSNRRRKTKLEKQEAARIRQRGSAWAR
ncbi:uncharacterized protein PADG_04208 [Paracoccidioides brasiliensis Pb18]|uniref:Uncharacterized protein n=1 Tax=Paracoccidioides brasiliensis (strain Pb18) TaxID=502780 RepID=C1GAC2_PARBD|nr:uncharacterized protein PADG_04208 [Paracoccidioides brasiliensis Pb18]EEH48124.2 hypothetical protein PADG_04208 [Paracoccidioides brasiliensis Pb18]